MEKKLLWNEIEASPQQKTQNSRFHFSFTLAATNNRKHTHTTLAEINSEIILYVC